MRFNCTAVGLVLASASMAFASSANAQYKSSASGQPATVKGSDQAAEAGKLPKVSESARKEIVAFQAAVNAGDAAAIATALAAAQAKAKSKDDKYIIAKLQLKAAADAKNDAAIGQAIEAILASGYDIGSESGILYNNLGKIYYNAKAYDRASTALEHVLQIEPNNFDAMVMLAETRQSQGRTADAVATIQKAIAIRTAAGQKAEEAWYKRAVALAFNGKLPSAASLSRDWVAAYPTAKNWRDAIRIYQTSTGQGDDSLLDSMRLAQATGALAGENDYFRFTNALILKGFPGEAKAVLDQGFSSNAISRSKETFSQLYAQASTKSQGDRASLGAAATAALAAPDAKKAMVIADAYYGYGDYKEAADLYRATLGKAGANKDLANLRLGMALTRMGDKAGATAALNAARGAQAGVAQLWLIYLATKA
jgi:tetratricopeptide (TPR) repeat protein